MSQMIYMWFIVLMFHYIYYIEMKKDLIGEK